ncbi:MAG: undecaprenyldiphospho-muramoylpentapeptide beta-N-acetylglucosaminyltransferase [Dissulfurispiraceae bacterium]|jgi:UDP-N-acetylglucosamine--N-acetylmuramyl-(pentapeptide) pyrophosphoryl-undecaprenol N-acetylglucosamine transferase|nr:undecaprenyldiphospho-muramoylpentapeptide beta-N-acetylglucosaminyltransferase [Dissulfurispiraceae bacterium]
MRVLIAGGGTGGHLFPGIAIAEALREMDERAAIVFVGTEHGIEARVVPREGYDIKFIKAEGIAGKPLFKKLKAICTMLCSLRDAFSILRSVRPDIVIGVGGYASVSVVLAAYLKKIPCMIMEQNSVPGAANRYLARVSDAICVTYQESMQFFPENKVYLTGNPVRKMIARHGEGISAESLGLDQERFTVFVFGGSLGARSINKAVLDSLNYLLDIRQNIQFLHQTGQSDAEKVGEAYRRLDFRASVVSFIYNMADAYAAADIVVCRAGATTLAELTLIGKPAILVPYPFAASDHQTHNAMKLADMGAARVIIERNLSGELLSSSIRDLYLDVKKRKEMEKSARAFGRHDAADRIIEIAKSISKKGRR